MDDNAKHATSYQLDQEILDARGINMTVEEVAGLPTCKYAERVHSLTLSEDDLAFLKGLRRRIKNRLASQNSRRRSVEHLRRLTKELRAVRACRDDALAERQALAMRRDTLRDQCVRLRKYLVQILQQRSDTTEVPSVESKPESHSKDDVKIPTVETKTPTLSECFQSIDKNIFQCRIDKLVQQSVNHIYKDDKKKIFAKTVFITNDLDFKTIMDSDDGVLNLSVKNESRRKGHGRKQSAPRRIAYSYPFNDDGVLDLKIKKENQ